MFLFDYASTYPLQCADVWQHALSAACVGWHIYAHILVTEIFTMQENASNIIYVIFSWPASPWAKYPAPHWEVMDACLKPKIPAAYVEYSTMFKLRLSHQINKSIFAASVNTAAHWSGRKETLWPMGTSTSGPVTHQGIWGALKAHRLYENVFLLIRFLYNAAKRLGTTAQTKTFIFHGLMTSQ